MKHTVAALFPCALLWAWPAGALEVENRSLKVTVERDTARMSVLHKATGLVWEQEDAAARAKLEEKVRVRRVRAVPTIDGDDGDWSREDIIWLPWVGEDGERNLSGGARLMWDETHLYLYVRVRDNVVAFGDKSTKQWWEADSIEFWVDSVQVGLHLHPEARVAANPQGTPFDGVRIRLKDIPGGRLPGYAVELAMPIRHFPMLADPEEGVRFFFAIGLNDADPEPGEPVGRTAQGYYPRTWVHSQPETFAVAVLTDGRGQAPRLTKENDRTSVLIGTGVVNMRAEGQLNVITYSLTVKRGQTEPLPLNVRIALRGNDPAVDITLACRGGPSTKMNRLGYPAPLFPPQPGKYFMAMAEYCDGRYVPVTDRHYRAKWFSVGGNLDMPWIAVTDGTGGMMVVSMTPPDTVIKMQPRSSDRSGPGFPGFIWEPSKGTWRADRKMRLVFFDKGGHVKACKIYRRIARETGYFRTLEDKARENPDVRKLLGAVNWWGADGLHFVRQAVAEGMNHGLVNGRWPPEDMREIVKLGWLVGEYDNYVDIDDSPVIARAKAPVTEHAVMLPNGELMTAWVSRDKDMKPTHTYMKHCTAKQLECARAIVPELLKTYPYNTRFLDVTPAESLRECYSPEHPTDRQTDMVNRQMLCKYFSEELKLVTGGEHGRFWSVPYLHYHEGMMGGGHYGWPAGYLRDVEGRDKLGERYLNYGINPAHRAPLFELVYHDCVVNYWYWGACSDYLHQVAPEITDRKTAMNVLYGTPPMMWVRSHGLHWQIPEERELMITIYRNVCRLHEIIGMQEMMSHTFLTGDRMVQRSVFADGTTCTVNFGVSPYRVTGGRTGERTFELGENDFYVLGPRIEQWRLPLGKDLATNAARETFIRTADYLFADSGGSRFRNETLRCSGKVTITRESAGRARIVLAPGTSMDLRVPVWQSAWRGEPRVLLQTDDVGTPVSRLEEGDAEVLKLEAPADGKALFLLLVGGEALVPDVTIESLSVTVAGRPVRSETPLGGGDTLNISVTVGNMGLAAAKRIAVSVHLDSPEGQALLRKSGVTLKPGQRRSFSCDLPAARADGPRKLVACIRSSQPVSLTGRVECKTGFTGPVEPGKFPFRRRYTLRVPEGESSGMDVEMPFDLRQQDGPAADPINLRVFFGNGSVMPAQFEPDRFGSRTGTLVFCLPTGLRAGKETAVEVLGVPAGDTGLAPHLSSFNVAEDGTSIRMGTYGARIAQGVLSSIAVLDRNGRDQPVVESIIVSSKETGWSSESGPVEEFTRVARGPVRCVFACKKTLSNTHKLTRRWYFYADRFEMHSTCNPKIHTLTRARYVSEGTATNDTGRSVRMDGQGEGEDFGWKGSPTWYAVFSDTYRSACIALTKPTGFTWWDSGVMGQVSLNHNEGMEKRVYIWGPGARDDGFARKAAEAYAQGVSVRPAE